MRERETASSPPAEPPLASGITAPAAEDRRLLLALAALQRPTLDRLLSRRAQARDVLRAFRTPLGLGANDHHA